MEEEEEEEEESEFKKEMEMKVSLKFIEQQSLSISGEPRGKETMIGSQREISPQTGISIDPHPSSPPTPPPPPPVLVLPLLVLSNLSA